jgi:aspartate-semialdehyde dehydrogenase
MAVTPLHRLARVKRMVVSTYQAASGAGAAAMEELKEQTRDVLEGREAKPVIFPYQVCVCVCVFVCVCVCLCVCVCAALDARRATARARVNTRRTSPACHPRHAAVTRRAPAATRHAQYAFNLFSHNSGMDTALGYNEEEMKLVKETKKIWGTNDVKIGATCVRVPVMRAHAESINLEFAQDISEADAKAALEQAAGVSIIDDRCAHARVVCAAARTGVLCVCCVSCARLCCRGTHDPDTP